MRTLYLHLGLHKTGTTSLQTGIFPCVKNAKFISREFRKKDDLYYKIAKACFQSKKCKSSIYEAKKALFEELECTDLILSEEWFTSDYSFLYGFNGAAWQEKIKRLGELTQGAKIKVLITVRHPADAVFSYYSEFMRHAKARRKWPNFLVFAKSNHALAYDHASLHQVLRHYLCEEVTYAKFEILLSSPNQFYYDLFSWLDRSGQCFSPSVHENVKKKDSDGVAISKLYPCNGAVSKLARVFPQAWIDKFRPLRLWIIEGGARPKSIKLPFPCESERESVVSIFRSTVSAFYD
jgi:hypothetical protein